MRSSEGTRKSFQMMMKNRSVMFIERKIVSVRTISTPGSSYNDASSP